MNNVISTWFTAVLIYVVCFINFLGDFFTVTLFVDPNSFMAKVITAGCVGMVGGFMSVVGRKFGGSFWSYTARRFVLRFKKIKKR